MANAKPSPLRSDLLSRKGAAVSAPEELISNPDPADEPPRREAPVGVTVKLPPDLYLRLKRRGLRTTPRKTNQEMIVEAVRAYLAEEV
jgi:hypothetical protein